MWGGGGDMETALLWAVVQSYRDNDLRILGFLFIYFVGYCVKSGAADMVHLPQSQWNSPTGPQGPLAGWLFVVVGCGSAYAQHLLLQVHFFTSLLTA